MKKYITACLVFIFLFIIGDYLAQEYHVYIPNKEPVFSFTKTEDKTIYVDQGNGFEDFEIKGVDLGVGYPGKAATDYAIDEETYKRWFKYIQEMGANTIRIYTINGDAFYNAFYEYNVDNENPLYLIHGVWLNDYILNSHRDGFDKTFMNKIISDTKTMIDVIHGNRSIFPNNQFGHGEYKKDISEWVLGYIIGVEWEDTTVEFTNHMQDNRNAYHGKYMGTTTQATPFEAMLAQIGDQIIDYETDRYAKQRLVAFSNWPTTDPFDYSESVVKVTKKFAKVDVEHIKTTEEFIGGSFASYHIYPYFPDYLNYDNPSQYADENGNINTYYQYLKQINEHHSIPVIISEFGVPSSRGMAQKDHNTGRNQGAMSEQQQGQAIVDAYQDIKKAGCAGSVIFTWHDEWFKRTWNTMANVDLEYTKNWSDYQTNEQYFGLLSFDPGNQQSISYVDGDISEWKNIPAVVEQDGIQLSMMYDEKFIYFKVDGYNNELLYLPIDTLDTIGAKTFRNHSVSFERDSDFVLVIDGEEDTRLLVNHRYNALLAMFSAHVQDKNIYLDPPSVHTNQFDPIELILQMKDEMALQMNDFMETYETGHLLHGDANPEHEAFNSLADFKISGSTIEIKLPWQLLNFSSPSHMNIHDDYYLHYGIEKKKISEMYVGIGNENSLIKMNAFELKGWKEKVTFHERLKKSYTMVQEMWNKQ